MVVDPDLTFHINAYPEPDLASHLSDAYLRPLGLQTLQGSIFSLRASILSIHGPLRLLFEPLKLLNFDFNSDPDSELDPAFPFNADP